MTQTLARLPEDARDAFRDPLGPVYADAESLLADVDGPVVTVGDVVTYHLLQAGRRPDVAVVDGRTEREAVDEAVAARLAALDDRHEVENPPATLTAALVDALVDAIDADGPRTLVVDGEEDLATVPAVLAAPDGATVVYGQPGEGMVAVRVTPETRERVRSLVARLDTTPAFHERFG